jgi:hypothetical protein
VQAALPYFGKSQRLKQCYNLARFENRHMSHYFTPR